jgi:hypothetical protein
VNIKVGSLRGTSGDDGTTSWPFLRKNSRKVDLTWLTVVMGALNGFEVPLLAMAGAHVHKTGPVVSLS